MPQYLENEESTMIRVLIVDDSLLARKAIERVLQTDKEIDVVGTAVDCREALDKISELKPSVITCDMEMPVMDGVQTLMHMRKEFPHVKVIVLSSLTQPDSIKERLCRNLGAFVVMAKPKMHSDMNAAGDANELIRNIRRSAGTA